jgi:hypothetical protein
LILDLGFHSGAARFFQLSIWFLLPCGLLFRKNLAGGAVNVLPDQALDTCKSKCRHRNPILGQKNKKFLSLSGKHCNPQWFFNSR